MSDIPESVLREALESVTGEPAILASDIRFDLRNPCADCPFMKSSPFHSGVDKSLIATCESIEQHSFAHTCHKTDQRPQCDGPVAGQETGKPVQHCAGSLLMLLKTGKGADLQLPLLQAMQDGRLPIEAVDKMRRRALKDKNVFTVRKMLAFYAAELHRQLDERKAD